MRRYYYRFGGYILLSMSLVLGLGPFYGNPFKGPPPFQNNFVRYILAVIFFSGGILLMRKAGKTLPGILLNPRWSHFLGDGIVILFLSMIGYGLVSWGLMKITGIAPYLYDPVATGMMATAYIPVTILFVFFFSQFGQRIEINKNGICVYSIGKTQSLPWDKILGFSLKTTRTITGTADFVAPRMLQTKLVIHTRRKTVEIVEPGLKQTKKKLVEELKRNAPDHFKEDIDHLSTTW